MKGKHSKSILLPGIFFLLLIIGSNTAAKGAAEGITQCVQVIIPSLFPFFFVSCWFNSKLLGAPLPFLNLLGRLLSLPKGSESVLLMGLLGGYPVGAKTITDAYDSNTISRNTAHILLGYCNNAGPAFIFGICHILFSSVWIPWIIWSIQILSAIITGLLLPKPADSNPSSNYHNDITLISALHKSISITAIVCGWIILFKAILYSLSQIVFLQPILPFLSGFLELSNGSVMLANTFSMSLRFFLFSTFLCAGGFCVYLQTASAVATLGTGLYLSGKIIQTATCMLINLPVTYLLFHEQPLPVSILLPLACICFGVILLLTVKCRKTCGNYENNRV